MAPTACRLRPVASGSTSVHGLPMASTATPSSAVVVAACPLVRVAAHVPHGGEQSGGCHRQQRRISAVVWWTLQPPLGGHRWRWGGCHQREDTQHPSVAPERAPSSSSSVDGSVPQLSRSRSRRRPSPGATGRLRANNIEISRVKWKDLEVRTLPPDLGSLDADALHRRSPPSSSGGRRRTAITARPRSNTLSRTPCRADLQAPSHCDQRPSSTPCTRTS